MKKSLKANITFSFVYQFVAIINGLVIPRLLLETFGSNVNGLVSSMTQMLSVISFLDLGVGAVVQVALYGPLSRKDNDDISKVYASSKEYFSIITKILLCYIVILCFYFGFIKETGFGPIYIISLLLAISISSIAQYLFGITNTLLLNADQKIYVATCLNILAIVINAIVTIICIYLKLSIQWVKLVSSIVFIIKPVYLMVYVKRHYNINFSQKPEKGTLKNKWSGAVQHISTMLTNSIDYIVLTFRASLTSISIYGIYVMPLNSFRLVIEAVATSYKSYFGNLLVISDVDVVGSEFDKFEVLFHFFITLIFSTVSVVITPFALLYTSGIHDAEYSQPIFSIWITIAYYLFSLRIIYTTIIFAAGHFKQTQMYCVVESLLNIIISFVLVKYLGLVGVAVGTCISTGYRLVVSAHYLEKAILYRKFSNFIKQCFVDAISFTLVSLISHQFSVRYNKLSFWFLDSLLVFLSAFLVCVVVFFLHKHRLIKDFLVEKRGKREL